MVTELDMDDIPPGFPQPTVKIPISMYMPVALFVELEDTAEATGAPSVQEWMMKTLARSIGFTPDTKFRRRVLEECVGKKKYASTEEAREAARKRIEERRKAAMSIMSAYKVKNRNSDIAALALTVQRNEMAMSEKTRERLNVAALSESEQQELRDEMFSRFMRIPQILKGVVPMAEDETEESLKAELAELGERLNFR